MPVVSTTIAALAVGVGMSAGAAATVGTIAAGAVWGGLATYGAKKLTGAEKKSSGQLALPAPTQTQEQLAATAEAKAKNEMREKQKAIQYNRGVYTSPLGLSAESQANTAKKTLLGG